MRRRTRAIREELINKIQVMFPNEVSIVRRGGIWRSRLRLKNGRLVSVIVCRSIGKRSQHFIWRVNPIAYERRWVTLLVLLNMKNEAIHEMRVFPNMNRNFHLSVDHPRMNQWERLNSLSEFLKAVKTASLKH